MKGKGLPVYFVQPTQMHKECSLATLDCYGFFFSLERPSKPSRNFIFALERPSRPTKKFIFALERPSEPSRNFIFALERPSRPTKKFIFALKRPSEPSRNFIFVLERPWCRKKIKRAINKASVLSIAWKLLLLQQKKKRYERGENGW